MPTDGAPALSSNCRVHAIPLDLGAAMGKPRPMKDRQATSPGASHANAGELVHASCVAWHGRGILLRGPSGTGKSALALRLVEAGALLVADDYVELAHGHDPERLEARPPARIAGLIEVRGLGLVRLPYLRRITLALIVDLVDAYSQEALERMPMRREEVLAGITLERIRIAQDDPAVIVKIRLALEGRVMGENEGETDAGL